MQKEDEDEDEEGAQDKPTEGSSATGGGHLLLRGVFGEERLMMRQPRIKCHSS